MHTVIVWITILTLSFAEDLSEKGSKRSYVCPPNFIRLSHRCYFFSKEKATWQNSYFKCRDLHSNLAIVKNSNQDKHIRRTLNQNTLEKEERWIGGVYDWQQLSWKWGASGKMLTFHAFAHPQPEQKDQLKWHCIILDPTLEYRWSSRNCLEEKYFLCHTKIKVVSKKEKRKLQRQYNVNKYNRLNEIPVPSVTEELHHNITGIKSIHDSYTLEINNDINAQFATKRKQLRRKSKKHKKPKHFWTKFPVNETITTKPNQLNYRDYVGVSRRRRKNNDGVNITNIERIRWKTYKEEKAHPLYPRPIVEEYNFNKEYTSRM